MDNAVLPSRKKVLRDDPIPQTFGNCSTLFLQGEVKPIYYLLDSEFNLQLKWLVMLFFTLSSDSITTKC